MKIIPSKRDSPTTSNLLQVCGCLNPKLSESLSRICPSDSIESSPRRPIDLEWGKCCCLSLLLVSQSARPPCGGISPSVSDVAAMLLGDWSRERAREGECVLEKADRPPRQGIPAPALPSSAVAEERHRAVESASARPCHFPSVAFTVPSFDELTQIKVLKYRNSSVAIVIICYSL